MLIWEAFRGGEEWHFRFWSIFFSFWRYLCFCKESDDVMGGSTGGAQRSIESGSGNVEAVFFRLGARNVHHKRNIMTPIVPLL